jgi:hypothetical protein
MNRPRVAVLKTSAATVLRDYPRLMRLAEYRQFVPNDHETALKINISWHFFYPACSTTPWQLDGVIATLLEDGYPKQSLFGCHNRTVVVSARGGEVANKHKQVLVGKYGLRNVHLYEAGEEWIRYTPKAKMRVLDKVFPEGIRIPKRLVSANVVHLPAMKTHVFTTITGAMKNAFGGLLPGLFAVMDGTFAGDGPGPRCMEPRVKLHPRLRRHGRNRRGRGEDDGLRSAFDSLHPHGARTGLGLRRSPGHRSRRRQYRRSRLPFPRRRHLRKQRPEDDLLGPIQTARTPASANRRRALVLPRLIPVPRRLPVQLRRPRQGQARARFRMGQALRLVLTVLAVKSQGVVCRLPRAVFYPAQRSESFTRRTFATVPAGF